MACKRSAVRSRLAPPDTATVAVEEYMHTAGRVAVFVGIVMIALGFIIGFTAMFMDADRQAVVWLGIIPLGFVVMLAGTVTSQLTRPKDEN